MHQLTAYIWLQLLSKSLHPYFAPLPAFAFSFGGQAFRKTSDIRGRYTQSGFRLLKGKELNIPNQ